jgi:hypothetical protein
MWRYLLLLVVLPLSAQAAQAIFVEPLVNAAKSQTASARIQEFMVQAVPEQLRECQTERDIPAAEVAAYFSSITIDLNRDATPDYLVFPSIYCSSFFGMHSIAFWLLLGQPAGGLKLVFSGRHDGIRLLNAKSNGVRDFELVYGRERQRVRFDGKTYRAGRIYLAP